MGDSASKEVLASALAALLKTPGFSPEITVFAEFVSQLSSRFHNLPEPEKKALIDAGDGDIRMALEQTACDQPEQLRVAIERVTRRGLRP